MSSYGEDEKPINVLDTNGVDTTKYTEVTLPIDGKEYYYKDDTGEMKQGTYDSYIPTYGETKPGWYKIGNITVQNNEQKQIPLYIKNITTTGNITTSGGKRTKRRRQTGKRTTKGKRTKRRRQTGKRTKKGK